MGYRRVAVLLAKEFAKLTDRWGGSASMEHSVAIRH